MDGTSVLVGFFWYLLMVKESTNGFNGVSWSTITPTAGTLRHSLQYCTDARLSSLTDVYHPPPMTPACARAMTMALGQVMMTLFLELPLPLVGVDWLA